jgi:hypothetical protein
MGAVMRSNKTKLATSGALLCTALTVGNLISILPCISQQTSTPGNGFQLQIPGLPRRCKNTDDPAFKARRLKIPVDLVDMPPYGGHKVTFVVGTMFPQVKGGPSVTMEFSTRDEPKRVLDWYKQAFQQYQWQPLDNMTGANGIAGMKSHNICQVMTMAPTKIGSRCDFLVRYKFYKADSPGAP